MNNQEKKNIYQRIVEVMRDVDPIDKKDKNDKNNFTFASHDAVTGSLKPHFVKHGIAIVPTVSSLTQDGNRTAVVMNVKFVNIDNPEDFVESTGWGYGIDNQDKGPGKAISYCFKYILLKMFCLSTGDDSDNDSVDHQKPEELPRISDKQIAFLESLGSKNETVRQRIFEHHKISSFQGLKEIDIDQLSINFMIASLKNGNGNGKS